MTGPALDLRQGQGRTRAVALVLPGGRVDSFDPTTPRQLAGLRMRPFAAALSGRGAASGLAVWSLRYRYRGWNGTEMSPVADARWALAEVRDHHGDVPIVLVGHSMGGRTAARVLDETGVLGAVLLAPWLPKDEPLPQLAGRRVLVAHGAVDRVTSPRTSLAFADRLRGGGARVDYVTVRGDAHAMLVRWAVWHRLTTAFTLDLLGIAAMPPPISRAITRGSV